MILDTDYSKRPEYYKEKARKWAADNPEIRRQIVNRYNLKHPGKSQKWHQIKRFGCVIPLEDCSRCGVKKMGRNLGVHHSDGNNGKMGKSLNNDLSNLVTLCRSCHATVHYRGQIKEYV
jgi:HNH endonuclease